MSQNFYGYVLTGLSVFLNAFLATLPASQLNSLLQSSATMVFYAIAPVLVFVGPFVNLKLAGSALGLIVSMELVRSLIAVYRFVEKVIPFAN